MIKTSEELGKAIKEQEEYGKIFDKTLSVNEIAELLKDNVCPIGFFKDTLEFIPPCRVKGCISDYKYCWIKFLIYYFKERVK